MCGPEVTGAGTSYFPVSFPFAPARALSPAWSTCLSRPLGIATGPTGATGPGAAGTDGVGAAGGGAMGMVSRGAGDLCDMPAARRPGTSPCHSFQRARGACLISSEIGLWSERPISPFELFCGAASSIRSPLIVNPAAASPLTRKWSKERPPDVVATRDERQLDVIGIRADHAEKMAVQPQPLGA